MLRRGWLAAAKKSVPAKKKQPSVEAILGNVFEEVLKARDRGETLSEEDVQRRAYEQTHEAVMGKKAFTADEKWRQSLPREPIRDLRRLVPLTLLDDDPFPVHARAPMPGPAAPAAAVVGRFIDAVDELAHWEAQLYEYLRGHPVAMRRALPLLMEHYTVLAHRLKDAMLHFGAARDAVGACDAVKMPQALYSQAEAFALLPRDAIVETGKSLSGTFDPVRFAKAKTGRIMKLSDGDWRSWKGERRAEQRALTEAFASLADGTREV